MLAWPEAGDLMVNAVISEQEGPGFKSWSYLDGYFIMEFVGSSLSGLQ